MKYIIIILILVFVLWKGKPLMKKMITKLRNRQITKVEKIDSDLVYEPIESSRTFNFSIKIEEKGGGKAVLSIVKEKDLL